uniref:Uncharacterized protein n=1 Tax=Rousettus aegyptiacus TaxID=9407 RepID=A0A7J8GAW2_ROUAE|nr:hypothetical protein HJG63_011580 [Rousettus aegyptiacus]
MPRPLGPLPGPRRWRAGGGSISSWLACEETRPRAFVTRNVAPVWPPTARGRRSLFRAKQWGVVHAASLGVSPGKTPIPVWQYGAGGGPERQTKGKTTGSGERWQMEWCAQPGHACPRGQL